MSHDEPSARDLLWREAIIGRMRSEEATNVGDGEIARTLSGCVCGQKLILAATRLRDAGLLSSQAVGTNE